ncbi:helix-turn-helix domain-containing protein [Gluconobacter oxydans]
MGDRLRKLRQAAGLKQIEVSAATGVDRAHLSKIETGAKGASIDSIAALADFYNVSIDSLYRGSTDDFLSPNERRYALDSADEIAVIELWREMDESQRRLLIMMLRNSIQNLAI